MTNQEQFWCCVVPLGFEVVCLYKYVCVYMNFCTWNPYPLSHSWHILSPKSVLGIIPFKSAEVMVMGLDLN